MSLSVQRTSSHGSPTHVAIIMDGNRRWAKKRGFKGVFGHREGAKAVRRAVEAAIDLGVVHLTLFGFSSENWGRPGEEIASLLGLLRLHLRTDLDELYAKGVRICFIGDRARFPIDINDLMLEAEEKTKSNQSLYLTIALSYGSRPEIVKATKKIVKSVIDDKLQIDELDEASFSKYLETVSSPDPDLLIRMGGEHRISNFMLWEIAYTELYFTDVCWPDFSKADLEEALSAFQIRDRRFGS